MGKQTPITHTFNLPDGTEVTIETGKLATQADGSALVRVGNTMILATAVSAKKAKEGQSFFPLSVDYQEKFASAGRIPGNFFRRETRLSDYEVLISRLVDRAIRPLFPDGYMNETQIIINLISAEKETLPDAFVALAASAALTVSDIPFDGPISEVRVARINGEYVINPSKSSLEDADLEFIVAATTRDVMMVEGEARECQEEDLVQAIKVAHEAIKVQIEAQHQLAQKVGGPALNKRSVEIPEVDTELYEKIENQVKEPILEICRAALSKHDRKDRLETLLETFIEGITEEQGEEYIEENGAKIGEYFDKIKKITIRGYVLDTNKRLDGRGLDEVRPIWSEVNYLPSTHGSSIFNRGETQSLTTLTLGTKLDEQMIDKAVELTYDKFLLHYNFPGYSVGEVKPNRGPGRREVGHANLAGRSLRQVMPKDNPYVIRLVSDILESNGSSSMATVCAGSLALMDGGIQIKEHVAGIAMGMIAEEGRLAILTDILGDEDALGDMDFKVTGTSKGICGCQMDIKIDGLPYEQLEKALAQAKAGRLHILGKMNETISKPNPDLKPHAPRMIEIIIDKSFIGAVIGPGGSIIQDLQEKTGTVITIEEKEGKGFVNITSSDKAGIDAAVARIRQISFQPEIGDVYDAVVKEILSFGAVVDFSGKQGLLHISEISHQRIANVEDVLKVGDHISIKLLDIDRKTGKFKLSAKVLQPKPERPPHQDRGDNRNRR
ncbi:MAG: polyribonucleotide nucleotidyltransferase [Saprospiraceae bacterium]|jgi:polyribonucleotide nucleotidyltransferase|nr:polyribonucleotide nucleotidyltransferase [Saprospiraceae bacterium]MCB0589686.1 polyribonucleotide nucleotidyltransferase [Saprospiraceae bacterium]MCO5283219.1 polyribonucleotide nucleotidyltransferase [Saprospiraceae bacterium]MCO6471507.1 polyribonucleotide nucleotidyltransferase [Saprospiraceae bacterium]WKZ63308.1 MAG: polyribonucleotide nucleotidyltransferase [Saprospiraceae bacterium]